MKAEPYVNHENIQGKTLRDVSPKLYDETVANLRALNISPVLCVIDAEEAQRLIESLSRATICRRCACGQDDCETYYFAPESRDGSQMHHVRFYSDNEHVVSFDDDYQVYDVERLYEIAQGDVDARGFELNDEFLVKVD